MRSSVVAGPTLALVSSLLVAMPTTAGVVDCAALTAAQRRQAETIGACGPAVPKALCLPATDEGLAALVGLLAAEANYQQTVPCAAARQVDDLGIIVAAGPGDGACTVELVGGEVANPQPQRQVALRWWRGQLNARIVQWDARFAAEAERLRVEAEATTALPEEEVTP